jgi:hypothetical protein
MSSGSMTDAVETGDPTASDNPNRAETTGEEDKCSADGPSPDNASMQATSPDKPSPAGSSSGT